MARLILVNRFFYPDESATSQMLTDLARQLAGAPGAPEVHVLTSRQLLEHPAARLARHERLGAVSIHRLWSTTRGRSRLPGRLLDYLSFLGAVGVWLMVRARSGDTVLAKTDPPVLGVVTTLATLGRDVRRVQWLQDLYPETATALGLRIPVRFTAALRDWSLRRSALVVAVAQGMTEHLRRRVGDAKLVHIPNWADDHGSTPDEAHGGREKISVGYAGNLGRAHPIDALVSLAPLAKDAPIEFVFSGGGAHYDRLGAAVMRSGATNWTFLPYQPRERLGALLRRSDVHLVILDPRVERFIFPSKVYGILSAGRPLVNLGDPAGEVARLVREHRCGWSLPADDPAALLRLLLDLGRDPRRLQEAGRNARLAYERRYSRAAALAQWKSALETV